MTTGELFDTLEDQVESVGYALANHRLYGDPRTYLLALERMADVGNTFADLAAELAQLAFDAGMTKKAIAQALDVPSATFRGMEKRVA